MYSHIFTTTIPANAEEMGTDLVSVIIPTYYRNELLRECLQSVVNQTYEPLEIIVVDDSGEEYARETVEQFEDITYVPFRENRGPNAARNKGIYVASGDYIQLLDDDDLLHEKKIEKQVDVFSTNPETGLVYSAGVSESFGEFHPRSDGHGDVLELALKFELPACVTSTMLIRRDIIDDVYPLPVVPGSDDTYWKIEFARRAEFDYVDELLVRKRAPPGRRSESRDAVDGTWDILDRYDELYDSFDDSVRRIAKSNATLREAKFRLRSKPYSLQSIRYFYRSIKFHPNPSAVLYLQLLISLFGRRMFEFSMRAYPRVRSVVPN